MPLKSKTIAIIGAGNIGEALIRGLLSSGATCPRQIIAADIRPERRLFVEGKFEVRTTGDNIAAVSEADVVLLAVKPQEIGKALSALRGHISSDKTVVTIAAGVKTARIEKELGGEVRVVRAMPNTPAQVGAGAAAIAKGRYATDEDLSVAEAILRAVGIVVRTEERLLDAVTALSGSGPAYLFLVTEAMIQAGMELGMSKDLAKKLSIQTVLGSAQLMMENGEEPQTLRHRVTSPGGTTEAALKVMKGGNLVEIFVEAIKAASHRSQELSNS